MVGAALRDPYIGTLFDRRYRIEERIAAGGFGAIYRAVHERHQMQVAIKVLHPRLSADPRIVARFRREGKTLESLRSPHTVTTYEIVEDPSGMLFIVMELLRGQTLLERFQLGGAMEWRWVVTMGRAICDALQEAHALGVVHRDLKPANIFLTRTKEADDFVKVLDFGIAKLLSGSGIGDQEGGEELTNHNEVVGTFEYVSPEQIAGSEYSGRSDIYTLGVVMYEMITGSRPFGKLTGPALMATIFSEVAPPPSTKMPGLPPELDALLVRCLQRDPEDRFPNVQALAAALDTMLQRDAMGESATIAAEPLDPARLGLDETPGPMTVRRAQGESVTEPAPSPRRGDPESLTERSAGPPTRLGDDLDSRITPLVGARAPSPALRDSQPAMRKSSPALRDSGEILPDTKPRPRPSTNGEDGYTVRKVPPPAVQAPAPRVRSATVQPVGSPAARPSQPAGMLPATTAPGVMPNRASQPSGQMGPPLRASQAAIPPIANAGPMVAPVMQPMPVALTPPRPRSPSVGMPPTGLAPPPPVAVGLQNQFGPGAPTAAMPGAPMPAPARPSMPPGAPPFPPPPGPGLLPPMPSRDSVPVFSTLEGWQAPPNLANVGPPAPPRPSAADRERKILIWAAVLGVAILIGVLLAVAV